MARSSFTALTAFLFEDGVDSYSIVGVQDLADFAQFLAELRTSYKNKAKSCHPDKGGDRAHFQSLQNAYSILCDSAKELYDATRDILTDLAALENNEEGVERMLAMDRELRQILELVAEVREQARQC